MTPQTMHAEEDGGARDPHDVEYIAQERWKVLVERFTQDMDPWNIDVVTLADRMKRYVEKREEYALEVPGRVILLAAMLLRIKAEILFGSGKQEREPFAEEAFWDEPEMEEAVAEEEVNPVAVPETIPFPVKRLARRKVTLDELKNAFGKALRTHEKRETRQEERAEDYGMEIRERDIRDRLESLFGMLTNLLGGKREAVQFEELLESEERQERINRFVEVLHLETDQKVECVQPELFDEITITVKDGVAGE